ncbi:hypothetical protein X798_02174 [Onchocerca flexuosa]|uniref:Uncharacterized protein n=2 Tax=Onchocerca flexuosa TaxID=387005 RepID=A0A183H2W7_9BILA|nr:hypothetical protein X798_02174 [Onchocerca flexuosa]VDO30923.1 unnamed protein product [Onchocerca flexuosa]
MKFASGNEKLEMQILKSEKKNLERANGQSVSLPIILYDHEPRSLSRSPDGMEYILLQRPQQLLNSEMKSLSGKDHTKGNSRQVLVENEGPSLVVKVIVCIIAFIIMVICLCFLFA